MNKPRLGAQMGSPVSAALGLVVATILLSFFLMQGRSLSGSLRMAGPGLALVAFLGVGACLHRARRIREEALGWWLIAFSQAIYGLLAVGYVSVADNLTLASRLSALNILHFLLLLAGILAWPWRDLRGNRWLMHGLGSLLFSGSLVFALWGLGSWNTAAASNGFLSRLVLVNALRITLVGGLVLFLISERPQRARGPLGWLLANMVAAGAIGMLAHVLFKAGFTWVLPFGSLAVLAPASVLLGALSPHPVEVPATQGGQEGRWARRWETLPYIPFGIASITLLGVAAVRAGVFLGVLLAYVGLTFLVVLRQILLFTEVKQANRHLDARVRERTRQLELLQEAALRTERLNTVAVLGAGLVHDLNNALSVVHGALDLTPVCPGADEAFHRRAIEHVRQALDRVTGLGSRLMAFARQKDEPVEALDLAREVRGLEGLLRLALPATIQLEVSAPGPAFWVRSTPGHLEQILLNLILNARDAMPAGGTVRVRVEGDQTAARLLVEDTGAGMPPEVQSQIFTPFFTTKGPGKGTGLGLASVRALVEQNGGGIRVASREGIGTSFVLEFPLAGVKALAGG